MEALGVLKGKWTHGRLTKDEYHAATRKLVLEAASNRIEVDDVGLFTFPGLKAVQALAQKHSLDLSDSLQLETILRGKYSHLGPNSASVLDTADGGWPRRPALRVFVFGTAYRNPFRSGPNNQLQRTVRMSAKSHAVACGR